MEEVFNTEEESNAFNRSQESEVFSTSKGHQVVSTERLEPKIVEKRIWNLNHIFSWTFYCNSFHCNRIFFNHQL